MLPVLIVFHLLFSLMLILFVLLHRGQGGGLSDMFGGGGGGGMQGSAVIERNLDRFTVVTGLLWLATNCLLVIYL